MRKPKDLTNFAQILLHCVGGLFAIKKPGEVDEVQGSPETEQAQIILATRPHHGEKAPKGKSREAKPESNPMEGEKAKEPKRGGRNKAADLGGIDWIEVDILDLRSNQGGFANHLIQATFHKAGMDTGEVDKVEIEAGLGSGGDHQDWNKSQRDRAIPKKAADHQQEEEVETVEELLVVRVLHLSHSSKLFHPKSDLFFCLRHQGIMPSQKEKNNLVTFPNASFGRRYLHGAIQKFP